MSLRILARRFRFYYKRNSLNLYRDAFENYRDAWLFPFFGEGRFVPRNGRPPIDVPRQRWSSLTTVARLLQMDASPAWRDDKLTIQWKAMSFVQPAGEKWTPQIMIEDPWRTKGRDLRGKIVIDIGAFIGDSSIAYALSGATVHAFEAVPSFAKCASENAQLNQLSDRIVVHSVALSNDDGVVTETDEVRSIASMSHNCLADDASQEIRMVDAVGYLRAYGIHRADVIKMNCEGGEYRLLHDARLLEFLNPESVVVDYHYGSAVLRDVLERSGYDVEDTCPGAERGTLFASKRAANDRRAIG